MSGNVPFRCKIGLKIETQWADIVCLVLQTSKGCRGDLVDNVLIRHTCPETYHFGVK